MTRRSKNKLFEKIKNRLEHQIKTLLSFDKSKVQTVNIEKNDEKTFKELIFVEKISNENEQNGICLKFDDDCKRQIRRESKTMKICLIKTVLLKKSFFIIKKIVCKFRTSII